MKSAVSEYFKFSANQVSSYQQEVRSKLKLVVSGDAVKGGSAFPFETF